MSTTTTVRPRSAGLSKPDKEDKETEELGEEGAEEVEEHGLQGCSQPGENAGGGSASHVTGGSLAPSELIQSYSNKKPHGINRGQTVSTVSPHLVNLMQWVGTASCPMGNAHLGLSTE